MAGTNDNSNAETPPETPTPETTLLDSGRIRLRDWLISKSTFLGDLYEGAVKILYADPPIAGWQHFTAHAVREIRNITGLLNQKRIG